MNLDHFLELPRVSGLALSPDGRRLITTVSVLGPKRTSFVGSLWEVSPDPQGPAARRVTWGPGNESSPVFRPDGSLLFVSARPDPDDDEDERPPSLWLLPAGAGEARPFATRPGGISSVAVAADSGAVVLTSPTMPSSSSPGEDERRHQARKELKVGATLHEGRPFRWWDQFWGPAEDRLFGHEGLRDLTGPTGPALRPNPDYAVTPDGETVICTWNVVDEGGALRPTLVSIDVETGTRGTLLDSPKTEYYAPAISADGSKVALIAEAVGTTEETSDQRLMVLHRTGEKSGEVHEAAPGWDLWPAGAPAWTPDGEALLVVAPEQGQAPVFRIDLDGRTVRRLTDHGSFSDLVVARDGSALYALRNTTDAPPAPVRIDPQTGEVTALRSPVEAPTLPGTLSEVQTTTEDGTTLRAWLVLPEGTSASKPAPLLLWVHGGPLGSWNGWHWRWNPWVAAAKGYAVLLPDPALSLGYGRDFVRRGWNDWGGTPYTDLMAITDVTVAREDIDAERTAAMGASYGGYMANWIAGHTDRFRGIVSHASIWDFESFRFTSDAAYFWPQILSEQVRDEQSPSRFAGSITTPMLLIHGEKDYRCPVSESLAMFNRLNESGPAVHRMLIFPDENHWVLKPQNLRLWYETVFAFLAQTVHGDPWQAPDLLR